MIYGLDSIGGMTLLSGLLVKSLSKHKTKTFTTAWGLGNS